MIKEALEYIFGQAVDGANPTPHIRKTGPLTRVVTINGESTTESIEPVILVRKAESIDAVARLSDSFGGLQPTVYVSDESIAVVLDDESRNETVMMHFKHSPQYEALLKLGDGSRQKDLVRCLRTKLAGCIQNESILPMIRQMEFGVNGGGSSNVQHGQESMGRTVERTVRAKAGELPEEVTVVVPLYSVPHDMPTEITLVCAVDIDLDNEKIALVPTGDSLDREKRRVISEILGRLDQLMPDAIVVAGQVSEYVW